MKYVKKIIFRNNETYNRLYQGSELLFEVQKEVEWKGLTFTALEPSTILYEPSTVATAQYSYDAVNWKTADNVRLNLNTGDKVYFKGNITKNQSSTNYANLRMTGKIAASGSIMSLQAGNPEDNTLNYDYEFSRLFYQCASLTTAPVLPSKTLTEYCYGEMFYGCFSLVTAPSLPATKLTNSCYEAMFFECTSLVTAPVLPATTLADYCYNHMLYGCTSLVTAPSLPATTLAYGCYKEMFSECISLVNAPVLPATTLSDRCYEEMFNHCTSLVTAPELLATTLASGCYNAMFSVCSNLNYIKCAAREYNSNYFTNWLENVAPTGDFYCYDSSIFPTGISGIPTGWTVHSEVEHKEYDALYVSGRYEFKIPKGDGTYYVIDTKNDCEADVITNKDFTSINSTIIGSTTVGDQYEWELFFTSTKLYFDLSFKNSRRLAWKFGTITKDTKYTIGGSNGNYLGTDRALYFNGSKKVSSTTKSTYNNTSDIFKIGGNIYDFYVGNIKIYEKTGLMYHIVPIMYNGKVAFYDKVNKRFMEITTTPPSEYVRTRTTGEKVII